MDTSQAFPPQTLNTTWQPVRSVAFSPDGRCLASGHSGGIVRIWDAATGESLQELKEYADTVWSVAFSPDGRHLASGLDNGMVDVRDAAKGMRLRQLNGHTAQVETVAFSADGSHLASGSYDRTVRVWDTATGVCIEELRHGHDVHSVAFSPDGHYLASASASASAWAWAWDDTIHVWDFAKGSRVIQKRLNRNLYRSKISFSADGSVLRVLFPWESPVQLHFPSLEMIDNPDTSPFYFDENSLCVKHQGLTLCLCWLPDYFRPYTLMTLHGNRVCVGGWDGELAFIDLDQFALPDIYM